VSKPKKFYDNKQILSKYHLLSLFVEIFMANLMIY